MAHRQGAVMVSETAPATAPRMRSGTASILAKPGMEQEIEAQLAATAGTAPAVVFNDPATLQGSTAHFHVYYQTGFANGPIIANGVLASCENEYNYLVSTFGFTAPGLPMHTII